jgi:nicotinamidase-related amidase
MATLTELLEPGRVAVVTMELQRGVVGDRSTIPAIAEVVQARGMLAKVGELATAARRAQVPLVHCTAGFRADRRGSPRNSPLAARLMQRPDHLVEGTEAVALVEELGDTSGDLVSHRRHGVAPFVGTDLDPQLRALGVSTLVVAGVSLDLGIPGLVIEAVDHGYRVVVARDGVAGTTPEVERVVLGSMLPLVARLATVDELVVAIAEATR